MANFDYKKWVTENKYGKLNEQETITCYGCYNTTDMTSTVVSAEMEGELNPNYTFPSWPSLVACGPAWQFELYSDAEQSISWLFQSQTDLWNSGTCSGSIDTGSGEETSTYYGCSLCPEGAISDLGDPDTDYGDNFLNYGNDIGGTYNCFPPAEYNIPASDIQFNDAYLNDENVLYYYSIDGVMSPNSEYIGSDEAILASFQDTSNLQANPENISCSGSGDTGGDDTGGDDTGEDETVIMMNVWGCASSGGGVEIVGQVEDFPGSYTTMTCPCNSSPNSVCGDNGWVCDEIGYQGSHFALKNIDDENPNLSTLENNICDEPELEEPGGQPGPGGKPTGPEKEPDSKKGGTREPKDLREIIHKISKKLKQINKK